MRAQVEETKGRLSPPQNAKVAHNELHCFIVYYSRISTSKRDIVTQSVIKVLFLLAIHGLPKTPKLPKS